MLELNKIRGDIDLIDSQILDLLKKRSELVLKVGDYKKENKLPIENYDREIEHLEFIKKLNKSSYNEREISQIFTTIFIASKKLQERGINNG